MNPTIITASGRYFDFTDPQQSSIHITDIARALSRLCRFTGHTTEFYSVAQHSVLVSHTVPPFLAMEGLLHDAAEAYLGDVSSPLKQLLPDYRAIEERVEQAIRNRFLLCMEFDLIKEADLRLLATEKRDLMPTPRAVSSRADIAAWKWAQSIEPLPQRIKPLGPDEAYNLFIERFLELV